MPLTISSVRAFRQVCRRLHRHYFQRGGREIARGMAAADFDYAAWWDYWRDQVSRANALCPASRKFPQADADQWDDLSQAPSLINRYEDWADWVLRLAIAHSDTGGRFEAKAELAGGALKGSWIARRGNRLAGPLAASPNELASRMLFLLSLWKLNDLKVKSFSEVEDPTKEPWEQSLFHMRAHEAVGLRLSTENAITILADPLSFHAARALPPVQDCPVAGFVVMRPRWKTVEAALSRVATLAAKLAVEEADDPALAPNNQASRAKGEQIALGMEDRFTETATPSVKKPKMGAAQVEAKVANWIRIYRAKGQAFTSTLLAEQVGCDDGTVRNTHAWKDRNSRDLPRTVDVEELLADEDDVGTHRRVRMRAPHAPHAEKR